DRTHRPSARESPAVGPEERPPRGRGSALVAPDEQAARCWEPPEDWLGAVARKRSAHRRRRGCHIPPRLRNRPSAPVRERETTLRQQAHRERAAHPCAWRVPPCLRVGQEMRVGPHASKMLNGAFSGQRLARLAVPGDPRGAFSESAGGTISERCSPGKTKITSRGRCTNYKEKSTNYNP